MLLLMLTLLLGGGGPLWAQATDNRPLVEQHREVIETIRCDCGCHPQSVESCDCGRAAQMREEIAILIEGDPNKGLAPMTAAAVIQKFIDEQGEQILISPRQSGFSLVAWLGPIVALVLGLTGTVLLARRWTRRGELHATELAIETADNAPITDADRERLAKQLAEWDR